MLFCVDANYKRLSAYCYLPLYYSCVWRLLLSEYDDDDDDDDDSSSSRWW